MKDYKAKRQAKLRQEKIYHSITHQFRPDLSLKHNTRKPRPLPLSGRQAQNAAQRRKAGKVTITLPSFDHPSIKKLLSE